MRDITLDETVYFNFTTRQFSDGVPTVLTGSQALSVLEEDNVTPITAGVSVEVSRASVVGLNQATIVATGGNGYEAGKGYCVYISTGTVGGVSVVGEVVAQFTIGASAAATDLAAASGEPAQGAPAVSLSMKDKISWLYKTLRNRKTSTATLINIYNDDATTVDHKKVTSDDGTTYDEGEMITGA